MGAFMVYVLVPEDHRTARLLLNSIVLVAARIMDSRLAST